MTEQRIDSEAGGEDARQRAREALDQHDELRPGPAIRAPRKAEDTSEGCHAMAANDRERASENVNDRMKAVFEKSADAWASRGDMFKRLEAQRERPDNG